MRFLQLALITAILGYGSFLGAENNGFYGAVGFQYSNITQSAQNKAPELIKQAPLFNVRNATPLILQNPQVPQNKAGS
ncbi:hypothetical protein [Helicobacter salomonis]|uniref:hypothetical protein n=1 Tax=Helicobacter salomonis TaxID=56878 RepID=UPI000CF0F117|nr:hypothetical protein [Helicobacter salomonis]